MALTEGNTILLQLLPEGGETKSMDSHKLAGFLNANMDVNVYCIYEVHGYLDGPGKECASLLVLRFELGSRVEGRRFKAFRPLITIHHAPRGKEAEEPTITDCIGPGGRGAVHVCQFKSKKSKKSSLSASVKVSPPDPAPIAGDFTWAREDSEEWTETYRYTIKATRREEKTGTRNADDQIYWRAEQGKLITSGIDIVQVAFVVRRKEGYDLELTFDLDADVDFKYTVQKGWRNFFKLRGSKKKAAVWVYEKEVDAQTGARKLRTTTVPEGIDRNHLRKLEDESRPLFENLAWVHDVEPLSPIRFHNTGQTSQGDQSQTAAEPDDDSDEFFDFVTS